MPAGWEPGFGTNHLQPVAESRCPQVVQATRFLQARYGNSRMTGSGSAVFARAGKITSNIKGTAATPLATFPAELPPGWVGRMCRSLERHPLQGWCPG